jgi:lipopolysaccharide export system protein LptA
LLAAAVVAGFTGLAYGQAVTEGKSLKFAEYYEAPYERQMKSLLECAKGLPQGPGRYLASEAKLQTFRQDGQAELVVSTPECLLDSASRSVSSPGPLRVETADGKFLIEGEGFQYQQTNSSLFISNKVHTTVHADLLQPQPGTAPRESATKDQTPIEIFSDRFQYQAASSNAVYQGSVKITGTNLAMTSGELTLLLPMKERRLETVTATEAVVVDYSEVHATGDRATYGTESGLVEVTGSPSWSARDRQGRGDKLLIDRTNRAFQVLGNAWLKMPGQAMGGIDFSTQSNPPVAKASSTTNQFIEVRCDHYEFRTNSAVFSDGVQVINRDGEEVNGTMTCGTLSAAFTGTNELQKMVADRAVVIEQQENQTRFTADKAVYDGPTEVLELTGQPTWKAGLRHGSGETISVSRQRNEMQVSTNAVMWLPADELQTSGEGTHASMTSPRAGPGGSQFAEITSTTYRVTPTGAVFDQQIHVVHPQMNWTCQSLTARFASGTQDKGLTAEGRVAFELLSEKGQKVHGMGEKAIYSYNVADNITNDTVTLLGSPAMLQMTNSTFKNTSIVFDRAQNKFTAYGNYQVRGMGPAVKTNSFRLPTVR